VNSNETIFHTEPPDESGLFDQWVLGVRPDGGRFVREERLQSRPHASGQPLVLRKRIFGVSEFLIANVSIAAKTELQDLLKARDAGSTN
jgi:hypothetical protein